jgi:hypothetical protein
MLSQRVLREREKGVTSQEIEGGRAGMGREEGEENERGRMREEGMEKEYWAVAK